ncbi:RNA-guided endonuclease TnpB family protein [Enterococcus durans]|uniref:RNA-guided endonuclease TnpB family protein n=1 Tax=Enterococcus durans TaxID=53345 RepID=UPI000CF0C66E|nr:RNA-guided endonuclease TnpB family protein [Enterococcus durans]PQD34691.1 transposase [Enterococcus durans]HJG22160.1 transposase [Enterococcus durans]
MLKAFKFRIYPTASQKEWFIQNFGCVRFTYNHLLKARQESYARTDAIDYSMTPATLKKKYVFLKSADSLALANAQLNLDRAFRNYFKGRASFPKLKNKKSMWQSYTTNNQKGTIYLEDKYLKLPKQKELIQVRLHRPVEGVIRSATISARYNESFYVSLLCEVQIAGVPTTNRWLGVAYDPKKLVETSSPVEVQMPLFRQTRDKMKVAKRKLVIKSKAAQKRKARLENARNYQKQKRKVMDLYQKQKLQKEDYLERVSGNLIRNYDYLFVEAFPSELSSADFQLQDWYKLIKKLRYKAQWYNKTLLFINVNQQLNEPPDKKSMELEKIGKQVIFE